MPDLKIEIIEIKGNCPVYKKGDEFYILDGYKLKARELICMHSLSSLMPYYVALSRGTSPKELRLGKNKHKAYIQCLDPCKYTGGGTAIFRITKINEDK